MCGRINIDIDFALPALQLPRSDDFDLRCRQPSSKRATFVLSLPTTSATTPQIEIHPPSRVFTMATNPQQADKVPKPTSPPTRCDSTSTQVTEPLSTTISSTADISHLPKNLLEATDMLEAIRNAVNSSVASGSPLQQYIDKEAIVQSNPRPRSLFLRRVLRGVQRLHVSHLSGISRSEELTSSISLQNRPVHP